MNEELKKEAREELRHIAGALDLAKLEFSIKTFVAEKLLNEYIDKAILAERKRWEEATGTIAVEVGKDEELLLIKKNK